MRALFLFEFFLALWYNIRMIAFNECMPRERARAMNAVVLAFVGDAAWS